MTNSAHKYLVDRRPSHKSPEPKLVGAADQREHIHSGLVRDAVSSDDLVSIFAALGDETVTLNVGGVIHKTYYRTLARYPNTRLFGLAYQRAVSSSVETAEFFFDNDPAVFSSILDYYRSGQLYIFSLQMFLNRNVNVKF